MRGLTAGPRSFCYIDTRHSDSFLLASLSADDRDVALRDSERIRQQFDQRLIRGPIHRRGSESHEQRSIADAGERRAARAWNDLDLNLHATRNSREGARGGTWTGGAHAGVDAPGAG